VINESEITLVTQQRNDQPGDALGGADLCPGEGGFSGTRRVNPLIGEARSCCIPGPRPALVVLLLSLTDAGGGCWEVSDPWPWLRLTGTLMVVFDL